MQETQIELPTNDFFRALQAYPTKRLTEEGDYEIELPVECDLTLLGRALRLWPTVDPDLVLGDCELAALDYLGISEREYIVKCLKTPESPFLKTRYPLAGYDRWYPQLDPALRRKFVRHYLPAPLDEVVPIEGGTEKAKRYFWEHFHADLDLLEEICSAEGSRWYVAGGFAASLFDPLGSLPFEDIDFWLAGENPVSLARGLCRLFGMPADPRANASSAHFNLGSWQLVAHDWIDNRPVNISLNCAGNFDQVDLLRYFDLDGGKCAFDGRSAWTTVRAKRALRTRKIVLPGYLSLSDEQLADFVCPTKINTPDEVREALVGCPKLRRRVEYNAWLERQSGSPGSFEIWKAARELNEELLRGLAERDPVAFSPLDRHPYLAITAQRLPLRVEKYRKKGFSILNGPLNADPALNSVLDEYLPKGGWIMDQYSQFPASICFDSTDNVIRQCKDDHAAWDRATYRGFRGPVLPGL